MFDKFLAPDPSSSRARPAVVAGAAVVAHLAVAGVLVVSGMWGIEKLTPDESRVTLAGPMPPSRPMAGGGDGQEAPKGESLEAKMGNKKKGAKKAVDDSVQPSDAAFDDEMQVGDATGADNGDDEGQWGDPNGVDGATGRGIFKGDGKCPMPTCGTSVIPTDVEIPEPDKPVVVPSQWLEGHLISGVEKIHPPDSVRVEMRQAGEWKTQATVIMCLSKQGHVRSLNLRSSSGYPAYDRQLLRDMKAWRYKPYSVDGKPVEVCTAVTFIYRMR